MIHDNNTACNINYKKHGFYILLSDYCVLSVRDPCLMCVLSVR